MKRKLSVLAVAGLSLMGLARQAEAAAALPAGFGAGKATEPRVTGYKPPKVPVPAVAGVRG
jgi:hypothetical protein